MANKTVKKKKAHKLFCLEMARKGMINGADGKFKPAEDDRMSEFLLYGYRLKQGKKKKKGD